jgi:energy-converting hydrogenase Eha subunit E
MKHSHNSHTSRFHILLAMAQGAYDMVGGLWPLIHMPSFEAVTGPKEDDWLVRSVAGILLVMGAVLMFDAFRHHVSHSVRIMAGGISAVLAIVALVSSLAGFISLLYFIDGIIHLSFALAWAGVLLVRPRR